MLEPQNPNPSPQPNLSELEKAVAGLQQRATQLLSQAQNQTTKSQIFYDIFYEAFRLLHQQTVNGTRHWEIRWDVKFEKYFAYIDQVYQEIDAADINKEIFAWATGLGIEMTTGKINTIHLKLQAELKVHNNEWNADPRYLNCKNGILDLATNKLLPHSPEFLITQRINANFIQNPGPTQYVDQLRDQYFDGMFIVERFMQAVLRYDLSNEMALFLNGPTGSGKGTIMNLIYEILKASSVHASLKTLGDPKYGLYTVLNKRCFFDKDSRTRSLNDDAVENFLKITGRDLGQGTWINGKWIRQFEANIKCFVLAATNQFARLPPGTDMLAFFRRVYIVAFGIIQNADPTFKDKIMGDIDNWFSELILMPYHPWVSPHHDQKAWAKAQSVIWDFSANPVKRYINEMFVRGSQDINEINQDDVMDWIRQRMANDTYDPPNDIFLKQWVTSEFARIRVRMRQVKYVHWYYPVEIKAEWQPYCTEGKDAPKTIQNENTLLDALTQPAPPKEEQPPEDEKVENPFDGK